MPVTPFHLFPAGMIYFLLYCRLHGLAFFLATVLIDLEPILYLVLGFPQGSFPLLLGGHVPMSFHAFTHNPFGIFLILAPPIAILAKFLELGKPLWLQIFPDAEWINYSWKLTYFSAVLGAMIHLGWDITMHGDINFGFPFIRIANPFQSNETAIWIGILSLALILPAYFIGTKINGGNPFRKLP
ncbi:MAG: hypothetical protein OEZ35_05930 [Candidatus Bathyarchaeota archaeon]|nr:hypothetical protein [Candidatus Bathyarchaeota archaeon]